MSETFLSKAEFAKLLYETSAGCTQTKAIEHYGKLLDVLEGRKTGFERWLRYEEEAMKANTAHMRLFPPNDPRPSDTSITIPRKDLLNFRSSYLVLREVVAELLELNPETMTKGEVLFRMQRRYIETP